MQGESKSQVTTEAGASVNWMRAQHEVERCVLFDVIGGCVASSPACQRARVKATMRGELQYNEIEVITTTISSIISSIPYHAWSIHTYFNVGITHCPFFRKV